MPDPTTTAATVHEHCDHWWDDTGPCCRCGDDTDAGLSDAVPGREEGACHGCVFCDIAAGSAPATVVREWDDALCIVPLNPVVPGHLLVLPRVHVTTFFSNPEVSAATMRRAAEMLHGVEPHHEPRDHNVITSAGPAATQTVMHLHVHIVPRQVGDGLALPWTGQGSEMPDDSVSDSFPATAACAFHYGMPVSTCPSCIAAQGRAQPTTAATEGASRVEVVMALVCALAMFAAFVGLILWDVTR